MTVFGGEEPYLGITLSRRHPRKDLFKRIKKEKTRSRDCELREGVGVLEKTSRKDLDIGFTKRSNCGFDSEWNRQPTEGREQMSDILWPVFWHDHWLLWTERTVVEGTQAMRSLRKLLQYSRWETLVVWTRLEAVEMVRNCHSPGIFWK